MLITSLQNPRIKQMVALRDRKARVRSGLMRVEGYEELTLALESGAQPATLFVCPALIRSPAPDALIARVRDSGVELIEVSEPVFTKMAYRENPDGWLAAFPTIDRGLDDLQIGATPLLIVAEHVEKPGNLGAILRTADAAGVDAVIAADAGTDWGNPNIVRASKGALFSVPVATAESGASIVWLRARGVQIVAATPKADVFHSDVDLRGPIAIAVGEEKHGLSSAWLDAADIRVRIPMIGRVNSLNVATATALLVYEAIRQRGVRG